MEKLTKSSSVSLYFSIQSLSSLQWLNYYQANCQNRLEPDWNQPCALTAGLRRKLGVSLSHFQLGETGGGTFLFKEASAKCDEDDLAALNLFVKEEAEHARLLARLLARLVERLGGRLVKRHWTHRLFKMARRAGGFHFEIQMLLTAEIVGTTYYEMIDQAVQDGPVNAAIGMMLRDEAGHLAFHLDRLKVSRRDWLPFERAVWELQFQALVSAAARAAWLDHSRCLREVGFSWNDFRQRSRRITIAFLDSLRSTGCPRQVSALATT